MRVLVLAVLFGSLALSDSRLSVPNRVYLSEGAGNRLVKYRVQPSCPYDSCTRCGYAEVVLKLVVRKSGTVKQITVVRARDSRLAEAALDAVKQWRYERYMLNGSPVEYETHTTVKSWMCGT
jgi:TonB family protein